jgi:hypothetical protein
VYGECGQSATAARKENGFPKQSGRDEKVLFRGRGSASRQWQQAEGTVQLENRCQLQPKLVAELSAPGVSVAARTNPSDPWQLIGPAF